jgi:hypothetical protein
MSTQATIFGVTELVALLAGRVGLRGFIGINRTDRVLEAAE